MGKNKPVSLAEMAAASEQKTENSPPAGDNVVALQRDDVKTSQRRGTSNHTSLYLAPEVKRAIKEIAFQFDRKPHDLYLEGIDLMLAKYGKPDLKSLTGK